MKLTLKIEGCGEAFGIDPNAEIARILREAASRIESNTSDSGLLRDVNGNTVGKWARLQ